MKYILLVNAPFLHIFAQPLRSRLDTRPSNQGHRDRGCHRDKLGGACYTGGELVSDIIFVRWYVTVFGCVLNGARGASKQESVLPSKPEFIPFEQT